MLCFSKKLIFPDFWSIKPIARPIEIVIKNLVWICLACLLLNWCWINRMWFLIDRIYFSTDRKLVSEFLKRFFSHVFITLFMPFSKSIQSQQFFVVFLLKSLMFLSSCASTTFLPLLFHFIHIFHAFFMHFRCNFRTYWYLGFLIFELVFVQIEQWVFVLRWR